MAGGVNAARQSAKAASMTYDAGGGLPIYASSLLQWCFRDVHATTLYIIMVNAGVCEKTGRLYLGIGATSPML
ncbi:MAG: hypothetical protein ETSY2_54565 [Candidatus Entotheonella gemina]|uniref:Acyl-CoA dehydrogenase C-terminal domain-containing protein n=1 Tax=Candidatus Entotheonella gemina TaxID=1429439 RepID=W4L1X4_9BACT|nr:MAG: hypothetical protein ETSY2_54565 [Candidatus Entotheonella gemina]